MISLDAQEVEGRYRREPQDRLTPKQVFERRWALTVLEQALGRLRREQEDAERGREFSELEGHLTGEQSRTSCRDVAAAIGTSEGAVKMSIHRLRQRFGQLLRAEISETVSSPRRVRVSGPTRGASGARGEASGAGSISASRAEG